MMLRLRQVTAKGFRNWISLRICGNFLDGIWRFVMEAVIFACSRKAYLLQKRLEGKWALEQPESKIICKVKCKSLPELSEKKSLKECAAEYFSRADALVFIGAAGIAVRLIAPFLGHKSKDPAVVVLDEQGKFCISLLSGHAGGANELTEKVAGWVGAVPVITTATDREGKFAVDEFARKNGLFITDWEMAKRVSVEILEGRQVWVDSELPLEGRMPEGLSWYQDGIGKKNAEDMLLSISYHKIPGRFLENTLCLVPKAVVVGIGCRKGTAKEKIADAVGQCLSEERIWTEAVCMAASIDLKKEEAGLLAYCQESGFPFITFSSEELQKAEGEFSSSHFVKEVTGVSCVCERSAVLAAEGKLLCQKKIYDGVTVALAVKQKGKAVF